MTELRRELLALEAFTARLESGTEPIELIQDAERAFQCIDRIRAAVWTSLAPSSAPAEPSGNTGELPVCATCRDTKRVPFVYGQEYDCELSTTKSCPDCSAAQPATEQPRIWRVDWKDGFRNGKLLCRDRSEAEIRAHHYASVEYNYARIQYSTDNGETWIDEQAEHGDVVPG